MKKIITLFIFIFLCTVGVYAQDDNSIQTELDKISQEAPVLNKDFSLQTFSSCSAMDSIMNDYIKDYWKNNKQRYYHYYEDDFMLDDLAVPVSDEGESVLDDVSSKLEKQDFSETNTQVQGVDESDIVKTDGKYVYYFNQSQKAVYIVDMKDSNNIKIIKKINIPKVLNQTQLYIDSDRLIIVGGGYIQSNKDNINRWYNYNQKTISVIYDTSDIENPELLKMYVSEGNYRKSRKIGDTLYVLSNNSFSIPYYDFNAAEDIDFSAKDMIPKALELTANTKDQNTVVNNKKYPYLVESGKIADCNEISYSLPDKDTLSKVGFSPNYNIISAINIRDTQKSVETDVIAGNNSEIYMSLENLYLTESHYVPNNFRCAPGMMCIQPFFYRGTHTLIHKLNVKDQDVDYQNSALIPGSPLTQYSMDEYKNNFRIITQHYNPERSTSVYILDRDLKMKSSLDGLGKTEDFKSSRFMGDKLFLVTFQQIDPFYVIDLSDDDNPKVLGELKIPGYSTYLHPYDENHIIGIGYDTVQNKWGGTMNAGLKIDLYEIDYDRAPAEKIEEDENGNFQENLGDIYVAQKFTKTIGDRGTYSEALNNPRMFMWNKEKNTLLLPIKVQITSPDDQYKVIDFYQGMYNFTIDDTRGIIEKYKITHIDTDEIAKKREEECKKYSQELENQVCKTLLDGTQYCTKQSSNHIPSYCYADTTLGEYISRNSYQYSNDFVNRALWIGNTVITISNGNIQTSTLDSGKIKSKVEMK